MIRTLMLLPMLALITSAATVDVKAFATPPTESGAQANERSPPTGAELLEQSLEMARLSADVTRKQARYKGPRRKFISASVKEPEYKAYMDALVAKIERVGNENYPEEARRLGLSGRLILMISIGRDGQLKGTTIEISSGVKVLDDAAKDAVLRASPFPPIPTVDDIDILEVVRTFRYKKGETPSADPATPGHRPAETKNF